MFIRPVISANTLGPEWSGLELGYEFDGDATVCLQDVLGNYTLAQNAATFPTQYAGKLGESRGAPAATANYTLRSQDGTDAGIYNGPEATILVWYYQMSTTGGVFLLERLAGPTTFFNVYLNHNSTTSFLQGTVGNLNRPHTLNAWYMAAIRLSTTAGTSYSLNDGTPAVSATNATFSDKDFSLTFLRSGGNSGGCRVDAFRLFNRWLTDEEITAHYNAGAGLAYPAS
jgi:hypothetical protein